MLNDFTTREAAAILADVKSRGGSGGARAMAGSTSAGMKMAMGARDLNDVTYEAFLANRRPLTDPEIIRVLPGRCGRDGHPTSRDSRPRGAPEA